MLSAADLPLQYGKRTCICTCEYRAYCSRPRVCRITCVSGGSFSVFIKPLFFPSTPQSFSYLELALSPGSRGSEDSPKVPNASLFASSEKCYQPGKSLSPPLHPHCEKKGEKVGEGDMMKDTQGRTLTADQPTLYLHCTGERTRKKGSCTRPLAPPPPPRW